MKKEIRLDQMTQEELAELMAEKKAKLKTINFEEEYYRYCAVENQIHQIALFLDSGKPQPDDPFAGLVD